MSGKEKSIIVEVIRNYEGTEIIFNEAVKINGSEITGLDYLDTTAGNIRSKVDTTFMLEIYNNKGQLVSDEQSIGTGSKLVFLDDEDKVVSEYTVILYGDANGDGKINSVDLLVIQRHILRIQTFEGVYLKAGNAQRNGRNPTSVDLLIIQRHILKLQELIQ